MIRIRSLVALSALATALVPWSGRAETVAGERVVPLEERVVPEDQLASQVDVRDIRTSDGTVSGIVVNRSTSPVRDVRLVIRHTWLWANEFHPGTDDPSRADEYTVPGDIPPGGQVPFSYQASPPLPEERGGRFMIAVRVASVVEIQRGGSPSPTAGTALPRRHDEGEPAE